MDFGRYSEGILKTKTNYTVGGSVYGIDVSQSIGTIWLSTAMRKAMFSMGNQKNEPTCSLCSSFMLRQRKVRRSRMKCLTSE